MKLTVIFDDGTIVKDGVAFTGLDLGEKDENYHALQWDGQRGYVQTKVGDNFVIDEEFLTPYLAIHEAAVIASTPPPPEPEVAVVTPRQARLALHAASLLEAVEAAVAASDKTTQLTWEYAVEFRRDDPLINSLGKGLGLTDEQIDQLFATASTL